VAICLERGADCLRMVQLMPLHPQTPSSLASFKSRLVLPFWYRLSQVVLEKRPLNGSSVVVVMCCQKLHDMTASQHRASGTVCRTRSVAVHLWLSSNVH